MIKDAHFFDTESAKYSDKRYPARASSYTQFFFKRRLEITLAALARAIENGKTYDVLEVGCADGVVLRALYDKYAPRLGRVVGVDIAPDMVAAAADRNEGRPISYSIRDGATLPGAFDLIIEIGVLNYTQWKTDLEAAHTALVSGGVYICSFAGRGSLYYSRFKGGGDGYFENMLPYTKYEQELRRIFSSIEIAPCGFFIPLIWKSPSLARFVQVWAERLLSILAPRFAHEKVYILKK